MIEDPDQDKPRSKSKSEETEPNSKTIKTRMVRQGVCHKNKANPRNPESKLKEIIPDQLSNLKDLNKPEPSPETIPKESESRNPESKRTKVADSNTTEPKLVRQGVCHNFKSTKKETTIKSQANKEKPKSIEYENR